MKKVVSLFVVIVMLASMCTFMMTGVSANVLKSTYEDAKDGDLLYEVKFGQTSGVYVPELFRASIEGDLDASKSVTITDNGRTLSFYKPSLTSGTFFYGGKIEGLTWDADKVYTMTMKVTLPENRGGVYFSYPSDANKAALMEGKTVADNNLHSCLYGVYGRFMELGDLGAMKGGGRIEGRFRFDTSGYKEFDTIIVPTGTFVDVTFLIEGYSYAVFVDGLFLDVIDLAEADIKDLSDNIGFSAYLYHI